MLNDKVIERRLLLKRVFPKTTLFRLGRTFNIPYFGGFDSPWDIDDDTAALEIALSLDDAQLNQTFSDYEPRRWETFRGQYYTFEEGEIRLSGAWREIQAGVTQAIKKYGKNSISILKCFLESGKSCGLKEIRGHLPPSADPSPILTDLEKLKVIVTSYKSDALQEWAILEETSPAIQKELGVAPREPERRPASKGQIKADPVEEEHTIVEQMDGELDYYLGSVLKHRLERVLKFGKDFSISSLGSYLHDLFGPILYFDSLLSITHQYGLADVEIVHSEGRTGMRTGWNLSLFGEPGTGKSFAARDMILGKSDGKVPQHGVPGRNRYAGGMTPARFIRIGQAYSGRVFNFIVPEFNDWFKYKGMVEPLKLAMERGEIKYETHREVVGPYRFKGFFSVNYNIAAHRRGYEVTVHDPNFSAIEDRMLCRLHRLTKQRFVEIAESQMRLAFGEIDIEEGSQQIRDHLTVVYGAQTGHRLLQGRFPPKPVLITQKAQEMLMKARKAILEEIPKEIVRFSARLEDRAIRFACAASQLGYFQSTGDYIPVSTEALQYAVQLYVEEASVRSREEFAPEAVLGRLSLG